jgi:hypothetical protein
MPMSKINEEKSAGMSFEFEEVASVPFWSDRTLINVSEVMLPKDQINIRLNIQSFDSFCSRLSSSEQSSLLSKTFFGLPSQRLRLIEIGSARIDCSFYDGRIKLIDQFSAASRRQKNRVVYRTPTPTDGKYFRQKNSLRLLFDSDWISKKRN